MVTQPTDISVVLSGGNTNTNPELSLGGQPSDTPLANTKNALFDNVSSDEQESGYEDYRCFYIFNDGETPIYNVRIWLTEERALGGETELGIRESSELQRIVISPIPTSGDLTLSYEGAEFTTEFFSNPAVWATNIQNQLNQLRDAENLPLLRQVLVLGESVAGTLIFDIDFSGGLGGAGYDDKRDHEQIQYVGDSFDTQSEVNITVLNEGSPINAIAEQLESSISPPSNVGFFKPVSNSPIVVYRLSPGEGYAVWAKRVVEDTAEPVEYDGFKWRFRADMLDPLGT